MDMLVGLMRRAVRKTFRLRATLLPLVGALAALFVWYAPGQAVNGLALPPATLGISVVAAQSSAPSLLLGLAAASAERGTSAPSEASV